MYEQNLLVTSSTRKDVTTRFSVVVPSKERAHITIAYLGDAPTLKQYAGFLDFTQELKGKTEYIFLYVMMA